MHDPGWELWRSFLAVARAGSLSSAARALGVAQPTVGRHVDALEEALGVPLFTRSPQGFRPTDAGAALVPQAEAMAAAAGSLLRSASAARDDDGGVVRVAASEIVAVHVLPPILADFRRAHPRVTLELDASNRQADLLHRDADVAVRMTRPTQEALVARRVGAVPIGLYAHRSYVAARGVPTCVAGLFDHDLIGPDRDVAAWAGVRIGGRPVEREMFRFRIDNDVAQLAAVRAGLGIGVCQIPLARADPDLVAILPGDVAFSLDVWVVTHEDLAPTPRVRRLFDHLVGGLGAWLA
jgi:DNA-binding transcriptional LysR family regulator